MQSENSEWEKRYGHCGLKGEKSDKSGVGNTPPGVKVEIAYLLSPELVGGSTPIWPSARSS